MGEYEEKPWLNTAQKEGLARVFDGFTIANGIVLFSYLGGRVALFDWEVRALILTAFCTLMMSLRFRKDKS